MDGILFIDKPAGMTSHDAVAIVRKRYQTKKVGHAGTLDPFATGLLILALGKATRIVEYVIGRPKTYEAVMRLGQSTDTQDRTGTITSERPLPAISRRQLAEALAEFTGPIEQVPPMFSAKKVAGTRLYTLARQGKSVQRAPRAVTIHALDLRETAESGELAGPDIGFRVECSSGTYVRTLAHDIGERLGCGAHLRSLRRTHIGDVAVQEAVSFDDAFAQATAPRATLRPVDSVIADFPAVTLNTSLMRKILHGMALDLRVPVPPNSAPDGWRMTDAPRPEQLVRLYADNGLFLGIGQWAAAPSDAAATWRLRPRKVLVSP